MQLINNFLKLALLLPVLSIAAPIVPGPDAALLGLPDNPIEIDGLLSASLKRESTAGSLPLPITPLPAKSNGTQLPPLPGLEIEGLLASLLGGQLKKRQDASTGPVTSGLGIATSAITLAGDIVSTVDDAITAVTAAPATLRKRQIGAVTGLIGGLLGGTNTNSSNGAGLLGGLLKRQTASNSDILGLAPLGGGLLGPDGIALPLRKRIPAVSRRSEDEDEDEEDEDEGSFSKRQLPTAAGPASSGLDLASSIVGLVSSILELSNSGNTATPSGLLGKRVVNGTDLSNEQLVSDLTRHAELVALVEEISKEESGAVKRQLNGLLGTATGLLSGLLGGTGTTAAPASG
ncbi:hypothetical protein EIP91_007359 [Steccherinum ochraceum]|uniref:Uncharacterized protein n=1 Tax=Steccherinum ochraceum TaxID=92696 RepID=A0A4R0RWH7_9APHY|nr:hypothetical protein EIP91_007359 [Steccherinum ochraceum]